MNGIHFKEWEEREGRKDVIDSSWKSCEEEKRPGGGWRRESHRNRQGRRRHVPDALALRQPPWMVKARVTVAPDRTSSSAPERCSDLVGISQLYRHLCGCVHGACVPRSVALCNQHHTWDTALSHHTGSLCCHTSLCPHRPSRSPCYLVLHLCSFVTLRVLYKCNHPVQNLLRWKFS